MAFLKKLSACFLLALYLFSATAMAELMKIPVLVEHYYDHRQENKNIELIAFLAQHYYTEDGTDMDADEDSRLPFKSAAYPATVFFSLTPPLFIEVETNPESNSTNPFGLHDEFFISSQYLAAIWQPPRYC